MSEILSENLSLTISVSPVTAKEAVILFREVMNTEAIDIKKKELGMTVSPGKPGEELTHEDIQVVLGNGKTTAELEAEDASDEDAPVPTTPETPAPAPAPVATAPAAAPVATPAAPAAPEGKVYTLDQLSVAGSWLVDQGKMDAVMDLLSSKYGVQTVTQLRETDYPGFAADLRALGANI